MPCKWRHALFIWACNGYCQALGWTPCICVAANWIPAGRRGRAIGIIGTSYQLMAGVTFVIAGWSAYWLGWRGALYVPAILLFALGFAIFGPPVLLVGTAPTDLARQGAAAAAAGFVNFMGYLGAFAGDQVTGYLAENYDWRTAIYFWAACVFAAACVVAVLWRVGVKRD